METLLTLQATSAEKTYFPLALDVTGKNCIVIGAGKVGWQKAEKLMSYGAAVSIIAREVRSPEIAHQISQRGIRFLGNEYEKSLLQGALLVFAATNDTHLNARIRRDAEAMGILVNVADDREKCRFISTAVIEQEGLQISIATHGKSSLRSRRTRQFLERNMALLSSTPLRIGSRGSALALYQVAEFLRDFPQQNFLVQIFHTDGDTDKITPIERVNFFDTLETALRQQKIDIALHSAKDVDKGVAHDMEVFALSESIHPLDALVVHPRLQTKGKFTLQTLPKNARLGVSGKRRREQVQVIRPDLELIPIRGNINERLALIEKENLDGIIIAMAALMRLGLDFLASETISDTIMPPHPLQGKLAMEIRKDDEMTKKIMSAFIANSAKWSHP